VSEFASYSRRRAKGRRLVGSRLVIRPARRTDLAVLAEITAEREGEDAGRWRAFFGRIHGERRTSRRGLVLVATSSRRILGYGKLSYFAPPPNAPANAAPEGWYLSGVVVRPEQRRRGVGAALTRRRLEWIRRRAKEAYYFANARNAVSIALHRRFGFVELTRDFWFPKTTFEGGIGILFGCELRKARR
jgi:ribosomal protein S18 acetylase RimI-like enzyme